MPEDKLNPDPELNGDLPAVTVDLEAPPAPKEAPKATTDDLLAELRAIKVQNEALQNKYKASIRVTDRIQRELDQIRTGVPVPQKEESKPTPAVDEETQRLADLKPWEQPLRKIMREEAERVHTEKEAVRQAQEVERNRQDELSRSQQFVLEKYPTLKEDDSELTEAYLSVVNSHPEWHRDPFGPIRAMMEMERLSKDAGVSLQPQPKPNTETLRRARAGAGSLPPGRTIPSNTKITLTKDQENFAKMNKIPVETYAKMVNGLSNNGGVEA